MNIRDIDLNLLIVFHRIYETRSISAAADLLDLSQPGMSHALKRLRTQLDDKLFVRKGNGVEPTVYADTIAEPIRNAISFLETSLAPPTAFDPKTSKRAFRILMADFLEPLIMPRLIAAVIDNPDITIELVSPQSVKIEDALLAGQIDLSVYLPCALLEEFRADPIAPLDMVLCYRLGHPITREPNPLAAMHKYR
ncbi:MAG: LysR family transcriptional regulator, partial [Pseudomonadota bacterium]